MDLKKALINEIKHEAAGTRKILERVPLDKLTWKPHEKSSDLRRLAKHVASIYSWVTRALTTNEMDFAKGRPAPAPDFNTMEELLAILDNNVAQALKDLEDAAPETFMETWTMREGDKIYLTIPKAAVIRNMALNHLVHHRGQLSVYLRLLDIPIPGLYGPTADEPM
jgi:uncharacterized damage-inducible protein DinB